MKLKVTLITENNKPANILGPNKDEKARKAWESVCALLNEIGGANDDKVTLESVEFLEDDEQ